MQVAVAIGGFTMAEADVLRKAMGKKDPVAMAKQKEKFVSGAATRGFAKKKAEELWEYIEPFAGYGFNKSHSVAYAMLAYKTAYLKAHYPVAFMAAMLSCEMGSTEEIVKYINESREMGIPILPPDVNESEWTFSVVGNAIRFGLGAIKGVGESAGEAVLSARRAQGSFKNLAHLLLEVDAQAANQKVFDALVKSGACDSLGGGHRAGLAAAIAGLAEQAARRRREIEAGQSNLFGSGSASTLPSEPPSTVPAWSESERLRLEKEALGFYLSGNPLVEFENHLKRLVSHTTDQLRGGFQGTATVGGLVTRISRAKIKSGQNAGRVMGRFVLEDLHGSLPVTVFADQLQRYDSLLVEDAAVILKGQVRERGAENEMTLEEMTLLAKAAEKLVSGVRVSLDRELPQTEMLRLRDVLTDHPGEIAVEFEVRLGDELVRIAPQERFRVAATPALFSAIEGILGAGKIQRLGL
jgi:DNA polymerase-3 subunit alpha